MKYLGIDYGKKKIGLAISDGSLAAPSGVLLINSLNDAILKITRIIDKEGIKTVLIGVPESGESLKITKDFIKKLKKTNIEIIEVDETLTTKDANLLIRQMGIKKQNEDAYSATLILQNYLDSK